MTLIASGLNFEVSGSVVQTALFVAFALLALVGAVRVVTASDPFISALSLLFNFVALGALYLLLGQDFVAISQILVYAGAVIVLFLFVIAYLGDRRELVVNTMRSRLLGPAAVLLTTAFALVLCAVAWIVDMAEPVTLKKTEAGHAFGSAQAIGETFLGEYVLAFEMTSVVLLVAAIGGIVLGLTGRARHARMRRLMQTRSADQQRRLHDEQEAKLRSQRGEVSE